jgi:hypothetical protein
MTGGEEAFAVPPSDGGPDWRRMTPADAVMAQARAARHREVAQEMRSWGDTTGALFELAAAEGLEQAAALALDPAMHVMHPLVPGLGGEAVARTKANTRKAPGLMDVPSTRPDMAAADASLERLRLAADAGVLTLATDMAETINASNSAERALAHQMAAAHRLAMVLLAQANEDAMAYRQGATYGRQVPERATEAARMASAAARLMDGYQRALLTLDRLRNGGRQVVTVQHVKVEGGGQAIVAGEVRAGGKRA